MDHHDTPDNLDQARNAPAHSQAGMGTINDAPMLVAGSDADDGKLLRLVHAGLRGRYWVAILVGLVLGGAAGYVGWVNTTPIFQSTGFVQIKSYVPKILFNNEQSGEMQQYGTYLGAQAEMMRSRRVVDIALQSEAWKPFSGGLTPQERDTFTRDLAVVARPDIEQIVVQFKDADPLRAEAGTRAVIEAYMGLQQDLNREQELARLAILEERRISLGAQQTSYRYQIEQVDRALGSQGIAAWHAAKVQQLSDLETAIEELEAQLAGLEQLREDRAEAGDTTPIELDPVTPDSNLIQQVRLALDRLNEETELLIYNYGPNHRQVQKNRDRILLLEVELERLLEERQPTAVVESGEPIDPLEQQLSLTIRRLDLANQQSAQTRKELEGLAGQIQQIEELKSLERGVVASLGQTRARIEQLNLESTLNQRMNVLGTGDASWKPVNGSDRMARSGIAGSIAFMFGFSIVGMIGLVGKRVSRSDILQLDVGAHRVLGLLPQISAAGSDDDSFISANASVDHIRSKIQLTSKHKDGICLAITGPQSGSGKTTLGIALARSFADSGSKTLLIDFDVIGGGLSHHLRAKHRKRLGELVADIAGVSPRQIEDVAERIRGDGKQLGQQLVEAGLVSQEHIDQALDQQKRELGIRQALAGAALSECSFPTRTVGLSVLPLRITEDRHLGRVGPRAIRQLCQRARKDFDVVLIDTGPLPGTVETSLVAAAADSTVVIVSKSDLRADVKACVESLDSIGAKLCGFVMNRATPNDMKTSRLSQSLSRSSQSTGSGHAVFGPIDIEEQPAAMVK